MNAKRIATITTGLALEFACANKGGVVGRVGRLVSIRGFARHLHAFEPKHEIPPAGLIRSGKTRAKPRLCTQAELSRLLVTALDVEATATFIRCCENAFRHFGGVTRTTVVDNLKAAVLDADWFDPNLNPKMADFAKHYGTVVLPTQPARPEHKGKIEAGVKYAQNNALKSRTFTSLAEQNLFLSEWERSVADTRIHGTVRQQVRALFALERPALLPLRGVRPFLVARHERACAVAHTRGRTAAVAHALVARPSSR